jgi:hypothetical protein
LERRDVEYGRRYAILREGTTPEYLMRLKFIGQPAGYEAYARARISALR